MLRPIRDCDLIHCSEEICKNLLRPQHFSANYVWTDTIKNPYKSVLNTKCVEEGWGWTFWFYKSKSNGFRLFAIAVWSGNWSTHMFMGTANNISKIRFWIQATIPKHSQRRGKIRNNEGFWNYHFTYTIAWSAIVQCCCGCQNS